GPDAASCRAAATPPDTRSGPCDRSSSSHASSRRPRRPSPTAPTADPSGEPAPPRARPPPRAPASRTQPCVASSPSPESECRAPRNAAAPTVRQVACTGGAGATDTLGISRLVRLLYYTCLPARHPHFERNVRFCEGPGGASSGGPAEAISAVRGAAAVYVRPRPRPLPPGAVRRRGRRAARVPDVRPRRPVHGVRPAGSLGAGGAGRSVLARDTAVAGTGTLAPTAILATFTSRVPGPVPRRSAASHSRR